MKAVLLLIYSSGLLRSRGGEHISLRLTAGENVYEINMGLMQCPEPYSAVALEASRIISPAPPFPLSFILSFSLQDTLTHTFPRVLNTKGAHGPNGVKHTVNQL